MACYFGCGTGSNRLAYAIYFAFLFAGAGCLIGWGVKISGCLISRTGDGSPCSVFHNSEFENSWQPSTDDAVMASSWASAVRQTCRNQFGFQQGTQNFNQCVACLDGVSTCLLNQWPLFVAGIVLLVLSFFPCFFCCCCASPEEGYAPPKV
uniref:Uncharacterized protein n=1 Tax=Tetraselmis sp. GSL018 TaxID=582737 RepID=A0A061SJM5_9CHLO